MARNIEGFLSSRLIRGSAAAATLALAGCNGALNQPPQGTEAPTIPPMTAPTTTTTLAPGNIVTTTLTPGECVFNHDASEAWIRRDSNAGGDIPQTSALYGTEIEFGDHDTGGECFERVVVRFVAPEGANTDILPGVHAYYVDQPVKNPSGEQATVAGGAFLQLDFGSPLYGPEGGEGPMEFSTQQLQTREMDAVQEIEVLRNHAGESSIVLGVPDQRPFRLREIVGTTDCPGTCIYIDVKDVQ